MLVLIPLVPGFNDWRGEESETQNVTRRGRLENDWDDWLQMPGCGSLEEGIKRDALLTAKASGGLGEVSGGSDRVALPT